VTSILHFADIHFGVEDQAALSSLDAVLAELQPDVSVISGDITQTGAEDEFKAAADWIQRLRGPKIITPGNHDTPMFGLIDRLFRPFERYQRFIAPFDAGEFEDQNVIIQSLNTARGVQAKLDWSVGVVDLKQLKKIQDRFDATAPRKVRFLNVHHPFIYPPEAPLQKRTKNGPDALRQLATDGCDAVLSGHIHVPFVVERQPQGYPLLSISAGTLSTRRRDNNPAFNHIDVTDDALIVTMVEFTGQTFVRSETFRAPRHALRKVNPGRPELRSEAHVLNTQDATQKKAAP
jgi:3',5'-cyclic AMP phosphodiesterase CpdA